MKKIISLLTDFGYDDAYVAIMKGVIISIDTSIKIIDICHTIPSYDIKSAAWILNTAYKYFPKNTIFISVVDPGVGTNRLKILVKTDNYYFIAPDNGLLSYILNNEPVQKVINITNNKYFLPKTSNTFHGRDIFAPVGAYLAKDFSIIDNLGEQIDSNRLMQFEISTPVSTENELQAEIVHIDKYGNLITNIPSNMLEGNNVCLKLGDYKISKISDTYLSVNSPELILIHGSSGFIEISACMENAENITKAIVGQKVFVDFCK